MSRKPIVKIRWSDIPMYVNDRGQRCDPRDPTARLAQPAGPTFLAAYPNFRNPYAERTRTLS